MFDLLLINAIHLLEANPDKIDWYYLSGNPNAIHLLEANPDKIDWYHLSTNPNAIHLLEANQDKIDWYFLPFNPNAMHLLEANQTRFFWLPFSKNPAIFQCDYTFYRQRMDLHREELMKAVFHPKRLKRSLELGYDLFDELTA